MQARRCLRVLLASALVALAPALAASALEPQAYRVRVNGQDVGDALVLHGADGALHVSEADLAQWRVRPSAEGAVEFHGERFAPLDPSVQVRVDASAQSLELTFPAGAFQASAIDASGWAPSELTPSGTGAVFNYELFGSVTDGDTARTTTASGAFDQVFFNRLGSGSNGILARDLVNRTEDEAGGSSEREAEFVRLNTAWTVDDAARAQRWEFGDTLGGSGTWGRPVRLAGVRWSRDFGTWPGFVTQPMPALSGLAEVPSTVEVYVNGMRRLSQPVPPGPFDITDVPMLGAGGEVSLVVRDLLGREQRTTLPFHTSAAMLRSGLSDFSIEGGWTRANFGIESADYGDFVAAGTLRRGLSDRLTIETRAEGEQARQAVGAGASTVLPLGMIGTAAAAFSRDDAGSGQLGVLALEPGGGQRVGVRLRVQYASDGFTQLGLAPGTTLPRWLGSAGVSVGLWRDASASLSQVRQDFADRDVVISSLGLVQRLRSRGSIQLSAFEARAEQRDVGMSLVLSAPLGGDHYSSGQYRSNDSEGAQSHESSVQVQRMAPGELGWSYDARAGRLTTESGESSRVAAGAAYGGSLARVRLEAGADDFSESYRATLGGSAGVIGGDWFVTRRIHDSFGVVDVPGMAGVGVYVNHQLVAHTDASGQAVLPALIPYVENRVAIRAQDLPLDTDLRTTELRVAPHRRAGVQAAFAVRRVRSVLLVLHGAAGRPLPVGAAVSMVGQDAAGEVAERGEAFLQDLAGGVQRARVTVDGASCEVAFDLPTPGDGIPRIGPLTCLPVSP